MLLGVNTKFARSKKKKNSEKVSNFLLCAGVAVFSQLIFAIKMIRAVTTVSILIINEKPFGKII